MGGEGSSRFKKKPENSENPVKSREVLKIPENADVLKMMFFREKYTKYPENSRRASRAGISKVCYTLFCIRPGWRWGAVASLCPSRPCLGRAAAA